MALFALLGHPVFARDGDHAIGHRIASFHEFAYVDARAHEAEIDQCLHICGMSIDTFWRIKRDCPDLFFSCYSLYSVVGRGLIDNYGYTAQFYTKYIERFDAIIKSRGFTQRNNEYIRGRSILEMIYKITPDIHYDGFIVSWPRYFILGTHHICLLQRNIYKPSEIRGQNVFDYIESNEVDRSIARALYPNEIDFEVYWAYVRELRQMKTRRAREDEELAELRKRARR